jgi:hypothetical protein
MGNIQSEQGDSTAKNAGSAERKKKRKIPKGLSVSANSAFSAVKRFSEYKDAQFEN